MHPINHIRNIQQTHCPECKYPFDLTQMSLSISRKINKEAAGFIRELRYAYPNTNKVNLKRLHLYQWFINSIKSGRNYEDCMEECDVQAILENINKEFPMISHNICRDDLIIDETNKDFWNSNNPRCVSRYSWEKLKYLYCDLEYHIDAAVQQCDLGFTPTLDIKDCQLSYNSLIEAYDCSLSFKDYTDLLNCNLSHDAINYIYSCGLTITPGTTIKNCEIRTGDGTLLDLGEVI